MAMHFGDMLLERRRAMGMSIQQVANAIKIRPQIIEFIETENFASMPPRGYAQGMISSYARYLGLNPRIVVDAYFDALSVYEHGSGTGPRRYQEYAPDASPRSSNATGRFLMVGPAPSSSRYAQRPPQAGYISEGGSPHEPVTASQLRPLPMARRGNAARGSVPVEPGYGSPQVTSRIPVQSAPTVPAGSRSGRAMPRTGSAPYGRRPPVRSNRDGYRDNPPVPPRGADRDRGRGGNVPPRRGGYRGGAGGGGFQLDPRLLIAIIAALLLVIVLLAIFAVRGCTSGKTDAPGSSAPKVEVADKNDSDSGDTADDGADGASDSPDDAADDGNASEAKKNNDAKAAEEPKETKVKVSIKEEGAVAFLEVKLDGKSVLGAQQVGPFEQEFTVTKQIEITTDKPSDVTVTKNGERVRYDMKVSGVAKVTITVPKKEESKAEDGSSDGETADGQTSDTGEQATQ